MMEALGLGVLALLSLWLAIVVLLLITFAAVMAADVVVQNLRWSRIERHLWWLRRGKQEGGEG